MVEELQRRRACPGALQRHVLAVVAYQLADPRRAVDVWYDLDHEAGLGERLQERRVIYLAMLVAHRGVDAEHRAVVQRANQRLALVAHLGGGELLGKAPDLPAAGDR